MGKRRGKRRLVAGHIICTHGGRGMMKTRLDQIAKKEFVIRRYELLPPPSMVRENFAIRFAHKCLRSAKIQRSQAASPVGPAKRLPIVLVWGYSAMTCDPPHEGCRQNNSIHP